MTFLQLYILQSSSFRSLNREKRKRLGSEKESYRTHTLREKYFFCKLARRVAILKDVFGARQSHDKHYLNIEKGIKNFVLGFLIIS